MRSMSDSLGQGRLPRDTLVHNILPGVEGRLKEDIQSLGFESSFPGFSGVYRGLA
jgi:hypothetical protein